MQAFAEIWSNPGKIKNGASNPACNQSPKSYLKDPSSGVRCAGNNGPFNSAWEVDYDPPPRLLVITAIHLKPTQSGNLKSGIASFLFALIGFCLGPITSSAHAWGAQGHQVIAALAEDMLTPGAKIAVTQILGPAGGAVSLASVSIWADDIRMLRPDTRPWHYATLQLAALQYDPAQADSADVVKALTRELSILENPASERYAREEALKWCVHLIGDLHQPLHVGEDHDKGGNLQPVKVNRRSYNLHAVWDYVLLERLHLETDTLRALLARDIAAEPGFIGRNAGGSVRQWADETHAKSAACYALRGKPIRKGIKAQLDKAYVDAATATVLAQLKLAAVRLAYSLNRTLDPGARIQARPPVAPAQGWRQDQGGFFRHADAITDGDARDSGSAARAGPDRNRKAPRRPKASQSGFAWSVHSQVYHFSACPDVARIKKGNLRLGDAPPPGLHLHAGCSAPR
jgi:hypothetical protein